MTGATGVGSWPGTDPLAAARAVRDLLAEPSGGSGDEPGAEPMTYLPELPDRGPGAQLVGRTAALLTDLPVELHPSGWRLTGRPGRDQHRAAQWWRDDLDAAAEVFAGYSGPLKVQVAGPWTLTAGIQLPNGEPVAGDGGACRDVIQSLAHTLRDVLGRLTDAVPRARPVVQLDEPSLPTILEGRLRTASGYRGVAPVEADVVVAGLREVLAAAGTAQTVVHCCAADVPLPVLRRCGVGGIGLDTGLLTPHGWEGVAVAIEDGGRLYAGSVPTDRTPPVDSVVEQLVAAWRRLGLPTASLAQVVVTPSCGLAGRPLESALATHRAALTVAERLAVVAADGDGGDGPFPSGRGAAPWTR